MKQIDLREQAERLDPIIAQARRLLGGSDATLYLYDPDAHALELVTGTDRHARKLIGTRLALGEGIAGKAAHRGEPLMVNDYAGWEGRAPQYDGVPWKQVMAAPLVHDGKLFGVLDISDTAAPREFTEDDLRLLGMFAELAALTLANLLLRGQAQRSEARYRALVEHALVGVYVIQDERLVYANPPLAELLGYVPEALVGLPMGELIAPEDRALAHEKIVERLQRGVRADRYTLHLHHRDGHRVPVEVYASLVEYNGAPASQGQVLDMSERLASRIDDALRGHGMETRLVSTSENGALLSALEGARALVCVGGDGTIHHALPALLARDAPVYHAAAGKENLFAREFGMSAHPERVVAAVERGATRRMDVGMCSGAPFALMLSVGPDASILHEVEVLDEQVAILRDADIALTELAPPADVFDECQRLLRGAEIAVVVDDYRKPFARQRDADPAADAARAAGDEGHRLCVHGRSSCK